MAPGKDPPDGTGGRFYKCHRELEFKATICLICEEAYHTNEFNRSGKSIFLSDNLGICGKHKELNLTSKVNEQLLSDEARRLIAQIKISANLELKKQIVEFKQQLCYERMDLDKTVHDETVFEKAEQESLKIENELLKDLNKELKDKNEILKELLNKERETNVKNIKKVTFAEVTAGNINKAHKPKRAPRIMIKKTKKNGTIEALKQKVTHCLIQEKTIQTNKIFKKEKSDEIVISCYDMESVDKAVEILHEQLSNVCNVTKEEVRKPKMKIVGIANIDEMNDEQLQADINIRNFDKFDQGCEVVHTYINKDKNTQSAIIEIPADIYKYIRDNKNRIYIGHQKCVAFDIIDIKPCFNCGRYGHKGIKCRNSATCIKCAGAHKATECKGEETICANCDYSNKKYNTKYDVNHEVTNYEKCEIFKAKVKKYIDMTDYCIAPVIPRDLGKVGNYLTKQMSRMRTGMTRESLNSLNDSISSSLNDK